ncbi:beta-ketoacyl-ACP synthase I [Puniceicoccales bacterium CK1056]|uniref:3-oxoacyl-[acyl-carrier-protein] synthase 1 n=1 Tax=Oceanipulchritudo coccoides TaxID=2706888 RepID=A0A6B2M423_9BACT|nr:beta-ketoacyl-ACP synthase I [Oceanipulchritudo coccoides]NDV62400.1 beta-ketoacyl-ACP synthase I [Oceanipulchritudo coccoides]
MTNRRVVITGIGLISCLGHDVKSVTESLKKMKSGICANARYAELGMRSQISGSIQGVKELAAQVDRKLTRFMGDAALFAHLSMEQAIADSGLEGKDISNPRTGLIAGSGGGSPVNQVEGMNILEERGIRRVGAFRVPRIMSSTVSANLCTAFSILGLNYSITSACATSAHSIGAAAEQIAWGKQDVMFAGGGEEESAELSLFFDAMGALSSKYNDTPETASRPFDVTRDGFVAGGGGAMLVLEEYERAKARGAKIYAELIGYGATSDGADMVAPSGEGAVRCMQLALDGVDRKVDYINAHGTSTPAGDMTELKAIRSVFGDDLPAISSTKSLTGHSLGATGAQEAIYSLLMMQDGFISGTANITQLDPEAEGYPIVQETRDGKLDVVLSNSFGFGGTNASLVLAKV